jgi:hypothetical protein
MFNVVIFYSSPIIRSANILIFGGMRKFITTFFVKMARIGWRRFKFHILSGLHINYNTDFMARNVALPLVWLVRKCESADTVAAFCRALCHKMRCLHMARLWQSPGMAVAVVAFVKNNFLFGVFGVMR